jgi:hypothetical protein
MLVALQRRKPSGAVPIWELEFHAWDAASGRHVVLGAEMERLTPGEQEKAMQTNAEIIVSVCRDLHFAAVTPPGPYWHTAPGELAYNVLPGDLRWRQFELLKALVGDDLMPLGRRGACPGFVCHSALGRPVDVPPGRTRRDRPGCASGD